LPFWWSSRLRSNARLCWVAEESGHAAGKHAASRQGKA
jgi:hypothetical protein